MAPERLDFVGRWRACGGSAEYFRAARTNVLQVQHEIAMAAKSEVSIDESELGDKLSEFLVRKGIGPTKACNYVKSIKLSE